MKLTLKLAIAFVLSSLFIAGVGFAFDKMLLREGIPRLDILVLSNVLTGLVAGALFLQSKIRAQEKERLLQERLQKISDMNHHVRNALQVMAFYGHLAEDPKAAQLVRDSIERIEWTLEEILPRGWNLDDLRHQQSRRISA